MTRPLNILQKHWQQPKKLLKLSLCLGILAVTQNCVSVESYQKMYLDDRDMELQAPPVQVFELDFQSYREGASGGQGGKTGGGCGCN